MNSQFLESLLAVSQNGSIAEAARVQGLTPAAISQRLKSLEILLGMPLTIRAGKTIRLTEAALRILPHAKQVIKEHRNLVDALNQDRISGRIACGAISTAMTGLIPKALKSLNDTGHELEIKLHPGTSAQLYNRLVADELDAVIITKPPFHIPKNIKISEIHQENLCLIAADGYLRIPSKNNKNLTDNILSNALHQQLQQHPFIRYDQNSWGGGYVKSYLDDHKLRVQELYELDALEAIAVLVNSGLGLALVPDWPAPWAEGLILDKIVIPNPNYMRQVVLLRKRETGKETAIDFIWQHLIKSNVTK
ncbi:LysR family transcriptional regulator [Kiloniella antarctica]|uniref:LysR family transcriptional regulator n=1 Tax=Kiloniella antarctica TaxID=1550907 RepID=A0ABW5BHN3_9PROT